jgi:hypothetical protein
LRISSERIFFATVWNSKLCIWIEDMNISLIEMFLLY